MNNYHDPVALSVIVLAIGILLLVNALGDLGQVFLVILIDHTTGALQSMNILLIQLGSAIIRIALGVVLIHWAEVVARLLKRFTRK